MEGHYIASVLVLVCFTCYVQSSINSLRKCCPKDRILSFGRDGLNCSEVFVNDTADVWWWLPKDAISDEALDVLNTQGASYGVQPDCEFTSMDVLRYDEFDFHVTDDVVRLEVLKESTFHGPDVWRTDNSFPPSSFCVDVTGSTTYTPPVYVVLLCPCREETCVRKCCHDGSVFDKVKGSCEKVEGDTINGGDFFDWVPKVDQYKEYYRLTGKFPKCEKYTSHVVTSSLNGSRLLLTNDGSLQDLDSEEIFLKDEYCGAHSTTNEEMVVLCLRMNQEVAMKQIVYGVMFIIGAICLLATVVVTAILPKMRRNIHGKMALAHNSMLFVGYLATGISQLKGATMSQATCEATSLIIQFSILAAFFWLNVMCIDISWPFSGIPPIKGTYRQVDEKKFIFYSLYAWGCTAIITLATLIVEYSPSITRFKPKFGTQVCFFNDRGAELLFFFGPMAVLLAANLLLFIYIACKIPSMNEQNTTTKTSKNKQKLILYVKLFCLMGVTWVTEVISWAVGGPSYLWYFTDIINLLRAVFIFLCMTVLFSRLILYVKLFCLMGVTWVTEVISWAVGGPSYLWYFTDIINLLRAVFIFVIFCCKRTVYNMLRDKVMRALGKDEPEKEPSRTTKSCYTNDSGGKTIPTVNTPAHAERSLATPTQNINIPKQTSEAFEMKLKE